MIVAGGHPNAGASSVRRPSIRNPFPGPRVADLLRRDDRVFSKSMTRPYPLVVERASGLWVTDPDGNEFLDFTAGVAVNSTGHAHPRVVAAVRAQADRFLHMSGTDFYYEVAIRLAERLAAIAPVEPAGARVFLCNSGTEAIEGAMKLARWKTGRPNFLAFFGAFHGRSFGSLSLTASKAIQRRGFAPLLPSVYHVPFPSASPGGTTTSETFRRLDEIFSTVAAPDSFAAVFVEPIQGEGGYVIPPDDFLPRLREETSRHGILLVLDEIQTGMGRTGRMFASEHWGVRSDIATVAKGIASGLPLGAILAGDGIMDWPPGSHGNTFGGNPLACAAAHATLDLLQEGLVDNAASAGGVLLAGLQRLKAKYPALITDARGKGLMLALELAQPNLNEAVVQAAFRRGLLVLTAGRRAVRLSPSLTVSDEEIAIALEVLDASLAEVRGAAAT